MEQILLVIHLLIAVALVGVVLVQRSEGGGLGIGSSSGGLGSMMSVRGTANLLTRTTSILAACFMMTSMVLAIFAGTHDQDRGPMIDAVPPAATAPAPGAPLPENLPSESRMPENRSGGVPLGN